jgi:hypothetical protein
VGEISPEVSINSLQETTHSEETSMKLTFMTIVVAAAMAVAAAPIANAAHHHAKGGCKGEFMYMKGGKCMDARNK